MVKKFLSGTVVRNGLALDDTNINVTVQEIIMLSFLTRLFLISFKLPVHNSRVDD